MTRFLLLILILLQNIALAGELPSEKKLVIIGDSLTEGYGVAQDQAFPAILEKKLQNLTGPRWQVINSGISGSTSASASSRLEWVLKSKPDFILLVLGGNDGLRGFPVKTIKENLQKAIRLAKDHKVRVALAGMQMPPNYGAQYTKEFKMVFSSLAKEEKIPFLPFLLEGVARKTNLNQADGIHPNEEGHKMVAETVFIFLKDKL